MKATNKLEEGILTYVVSQNVANLRQAAFISGQNYINLRAGRAGHFRYFKIFSLIKNDFFAFFIKLI